MLRPMITIINLGTAKLIPPKVITPVYVAGRLRAEGPKMRSPACPMIIISPRAATIVVRNLCSDAMRYSQKLCLRG